jgi:ADP-ribose diphosphatase
LTAGTGPERSRGTYAASMNDDHLIETTVAQRIVHQGRFMTFRVDTIVDAAGARHMREVVDHPGAVCIVPVLGEELLLVRQFRTAVGQVLLELPAGTLDRAPDGTLEDPASAASRELGEETGYRAGSWRPLGSFWTAPGFTNELMHLYLATELEALEDYDGPDHDEYLDLVRMPWHEAVQLAATGRIADAKSLVGLLHLARLRESGEVA